MTRFVPAEELFKGRHFGPGDRAALRPLVSGIRAAMEAVRASRRGLLADRCDVCKGALSLGLPVSSGGQAGGLAVDFYLSQKRDVEAAQQFLRQAMKHQRVPPKITLDAYAASHRAVTELKDYGELPKRVRVRSSKHLNNRIAQDHRRVKQTHSGDDRPQEFRGGGGDDLRDRAGGEDQEEAVQDRQAKQSNGPDAGNLASCNGRVNPIRREIQQTSCRYPFQDRIAPEPSRRAAERRVAEFPADAWWAGLCGRQ